MRKALLYYLYGTSNAGDMAICLGAADLLKEKGYAVTMVSRFSASEQEYVRSKEFIQRYYPDVEVYPGPFSFERGFSTVKKIKSYAVSFLKICHVLPDKLNRKLIAEHDVVFFNGGNLLRGETIADYLRLTALFYPIELAKKMKKPVFCLPQSTAGISFTGKQLLKKFFYGLQKIYVREEMSFRELSTQFPAVPFLCSTDLAFFCSDNSVAIKGFKEKYGKFSYVDVTIILRSTGIGDIGFLDQTLSDKMVGMLEEYVHHHPELKYRIIVQTQKDREFSERFLRRIVCFACVELVEEHDPLILREMYKHTSFTISMRLHAAILSLSAGTPVVGIFSEVWGLKNPGIMSSYDMPYMIVEQGGGTLDNLIESIPENVKERIHDIIHSEREAIAFEDE